MSDDKDLSSSEEMHTSLSSFSIPLTPSFSCNFAVSLPAFLPLLQREVFPFETEPGQWHALQGLLNLGAANAADGLQVGRDRERGGMKEEKG